ncbi:hypothetical protein VA7868_01328 [Vibrio aerogenes CECT 7868]|uniref:Uncharacterized protein n=1 Tax=Vibrio aerogenes CECT 7868 TaxID=1216006 RepID=A0A1M5XUK9_9VIBR|nr:hypothetical protein VA7868_01328 [Vibrio aerogenes CECT 7868]
MAGKEGVGAGSDVPEKFDVQGMTLFSHRQYLLMNLSCFFERDCRILANTKAFILAIEATAVLKSDICLR